MDLDRVPENGRRPVLLITADPALRADALRVAAAADCVVLEQDLPVGKSSVGSSLVRLKWDDAAVVLLDVETSRQVLSHRLPRREGVVVLARGGADVEHWRMATAVGAARVLELPLQEEELVQLLGAGRDRESGNGGVIAVIGARGGAGASTLAASLALAASESGAGTLLIDGDGYGGGIDLRLGWEDAPGLRWSGLVVEAGRISGEALHGALPSHGSLSVLSGGRADSSSVSGGVDAIAVAAVIDAGRRAGDLVVCDVPRHRGPHTDAFLDAADLVVLLVPAELGAVAGAENLAGYLSTRNSNVGLVVRGPAPGGLRGVDIAHALDLPMLASMRPQPGLAEQVERSGFKLGRRTPLASASAAILETFARKPQSNRQPA